VFGNGDGTFRKGFYLGQNQEAAAGDFNGDGKLDIVQARGLGVSIFLGNGDGTFGAPTTFLAGNNSWFAAVGDFNGDGKLDVAAADETSDNITILTNTTP
jgi:hypothetical protein